MLKVSVIVPVYNVEDYIDRCLDSLVKQSLKDIEIIVVNDGSPDNSQKIIDKYAKKYKQVKSFVKENGGLSDARNYGIDKAKGEYITFVDSDDYVDNNMYEIMYNKAKSGNFDIVVCNLNYVYEDRIEKAFSNIEMDTTNIKKAMINIYPSASNKIFKKNLFNNGVEFKKGVWFEDVEFIYRLLPYVKTIGVVNDFLYQYVQRDGTIMKTVNEKIYHYIYNWNGILDFYHERKLYEEYKKELEYSYVRYIYATFIKHATGFNEEEFEKAINEAKLNVNKNFPNYRKNKYFYKSLKGIYLLFFNKYIAKLVYKKRHKVY